MIIPVPLHLLAVCVPVEAVPHPAEDDFLATEVGIRLGFVGGIILNTIVRNRDGVAFKEKETCVSTAPANDEYFWNQWFS